ncbi:MAG: hypothetical protein JNM22_09265 [Saprospiraceae bacterium]|nr:hypothetical protein [Saprospiraceae bacterium]
MTSKLFSSTAHFSICFFMLFSAAVSAQKTNVWRGGAPGHETDWSFFKNWSTGKVPSEFDNVIVPDVSASTGDYPVIRTGEVEILGLEIQSGASLTLMPEARLLVETLQISGTCKGCKSRILMEGSGDLRGMAASTGH